MWGKGPFGADGNELDRPRRCQAMLDLRCIYLTEQWESFITFRIAHDTQRLYPYRDTLQALSWSVAAEPRSNHRMQDRLAPAQFGVDAYSP